MVGVDDGGYDVTTKGGTNLIEQVLIVLARLLVVVVAYFQLRAVGGKATRQRRAHTGTQVAADDGGAHQGYLRLLLLEEIDEDVGVGSRGIGEESLCVEDIELVYAVGKNLVFNFAFDACSGNNGLKVHTELVGQLAAFGQKLLGDFLHGGAFYFTIYKYVVHISCC